MPRGIIPRTAPGKPGTAPGTGAIPGIPAAKNGIPRNACMPGGTPPGMAQGGITWGTPGIPCGSCGAAELGWGRLDGGWGRLDGGAAR